MQKFITALQSQAEEYARRHNLKVHDIAFRNERAGKVLRINLDGEVNLEDCATVSRLISEWLDENESLIPYSNYTLEVSSLGADRPLSTMADFEARLGKMCRISTKIKDPTGRKRYKGQIKSVSPTNVTIYTEEESAEFTIDLNNIEKARLEIEIKEDDSK